MLIWGILVTRRSSVENQKGLSTSHLHTQSDPITSNDMILFVSGASKKIESTVLNVLRYNNMGPSCKKIESALHKETNIRCLVNISQ